MNVRGWCGAYVLLTLTHSIIYFHISLYANYTGFAPAQTACQAVEEPNQSTKLTPNSQTTHAVHVYYLEFGMVNCDKKLLMINKLRGKVSMLRNFNAGWGMLRV